VSTDTQPLAQWEVELLDATVADLSAEVPCQWLIPCTATATWALVNACCGLTSSVCEPHKHKSEAEVQQLMTDGGYDCRRCGAFNPGYTWRLL
jgi:hypothetical protein